MSRLFHSLVVCGAGLTLLSCGGRSASNDRDTEPAEGGSASQGGAGSGNGNAGSASTAGSGTLLLPIGGAPPVNVAGSSALAGSAPSTPGPLLPGAEGQWVCGAELKEGCSSGSYEGVEVVGFHIASACAADPTRPKSSADCTGTARFGCSIGFFEEQAVLFNCECRTPAVSEGCFCPETGTSCYGSGGPEYCDELQAYCGCAMTCIAK